MLERARGVVPNLVEAIAGETIVGSWWSHPEGKRIFNILNAVADSADILRCRLIDGKITYAHRRVWPALIVLSPHIGDRRLDRHSQEHTPTGAHKTVTTPFPKWVPAEARALAKTLSQADALATVAPFIPQS